MSESGEDLASKITRLVEERGWNVEDFARISRLNRHTVRSIVQGGEKKLRNATISQCANALGLTVRDLRSQPIEILLPRMRGKTELSEDYHQYLTENATQTELISWIQRNPQRANELTLDEVHELLQSQGAHGALTQLGVEPYIRMVESRREFIRKLKMIHGTEYQKILEPLVDLIFEKIRM
jgi:transcriptional regulator with XRE-family HTH domain